MSTRYYAFLLLLTLSSLFLACKQAPEKEGPSKLVPAYTPSYAKGFDILRPEGSTSARLLRLYQQGAAPQELLLSTDTNNTHDALQTPVKSIVVSSTTHIAMLELLGVEDRLVGFPNTDYVSSEKTRKRIDQGWVTDLGHEEHINTESLLALKPDVMVGFSIQGNKHLFSIIRNTGIPVLINNDWLEETPLGRAEWIRFFGVLFDKEKEADSIFRQIEQEYLSAKALAAATVNKPSVLSGGLFKDSWHLPAGESFEASFLKDAHMNYLWKHSRGKGSLTLNIEQVIDRGAMADLWISPSFHGSLSAIENSHELYGEFKAFRDKKVYSFVNKRGATGGLIYFELAPTRPDLVLKDLIKIAHPTLLTDYELTFFEWLE